MTLHNMNSHNYSLMISFAKFLGLKELKAKKFIDIGIIEIEKFPTWIVSLNDGTSLAYKMITMFICAEESCHHIFKRGMIDFSHINLSFMGALDKMDTTHDLGSLEAMSDDFLQVKWMLPLVKSEKKTLSQVFSREAVCKSIIDAMKNISKEVHYMFEQLKKFAEELHFGDKNKYSRHFEYLFTEYLPAHLSYVEGLITRLQKPCSDMDSFITNGPAVSIWIPSF